RLLQIETAQGLTLTASTERYRPQSSGDKNKSENWYPVFQPAWSLDPIVVAFRDIRTWRFFSPVEPPMTMFEPVVQRADPVFSGGWHWQRNQSVQKTPLRNVSLLAGWGFGVHAPTEMAFPLHPAVTGVRSRAGLDQVVEQGGSAEASVALSTTEASPLFKSGVLIGSTVTADTNWLNVSAPAGTNVSLKLKADPAITSRPAGSDPFDIRDCIDWLEPQWRLDAARLQTEVQSRLPQSLSALRKWKAASKLFPGDLDAEEQKSLTHGINLVGFRDDTRPGASRYRLALQPQDQFVVLTRSLRIDRGHQWLALCLSRQPGDTTPTLVQVRIDGRACLQQAVPERTGRVDPDPLLVPVSAVAGQTVPVEVILITQGDKSYVDWRGTKLLSHRPGLVKLFDEEGDFLESLRDGEGAASLSTTEKHTGDQSLKITGGEAASAAIDGWQFPIREFPQLGEYRYFRFAWKKDGGTGIGLRIGHDGELGLPAVEVGQQKQVRAFPAAAAQPLRNRRLRSRNPRSQEISDARGARFGYQYDAGTRDADEPVLRLDKKLPAEWTAVARDIFGEFGAFSLTGLGFDCPDGNSAVFDQIYLARTQSDFEFIPEAIGGSVEPAISDNENVIASGGRPESIGVLLSKVAPQFTLDKSGEPVLHLKEYAGRTDIIQTMPPAQGVPCILRAPVSIRTGKKTVLTAAVQRHPEGDWQLNVKVGTEQLHSSMIDADSTKDGWVELEVDLSKFAGTNIVVDVHHHPNNWMYEHAYWSRLAIVEK
ncbi:MAG: NPCBM/NEW2 domain-containing protein, partial [Planctomycetaceae bacterium]